MTLLTSSLAGQFIFLCFGIFFLFFLASAFFTKRTIERGGQGWRVAVLLIAIVVFVLSPRIRTHPLDTSRVLWPQTLAVGSIADTVTLLGLSIGNLNRVFFYPRPIWEFGEERDGRLESGPQDTLFRRARAFFRRTETRFFPEW